MQQNIRKVRFYKGLQEVSSCKFANRSVLQSGFIPLISNNNLIGSTSSVPYSIVQAFGLALLLTARGHWL